MSAYSLFCQPKSVLIDFGKALLRVPGNQEGIDQGGVVGLVSPSKRDFCYVCDCWHFNLSQFI